MRKVHLHGSLRKYGEVLDLEVGTAIEAITALSANFPGFLNDLKEGSWHVMRGDAQTGMPLDEEMVKGFKLGAADLHFIPQAIGAKDNGGSLKAILGATLVVATFGQAAPLTAAALSGSSAWGNAIGQLGFAMALSGVSTMLAPETESQSEEKSYTITGPVSGYGQGRSVQIVYGGPIIVGGMLISGGMNATGLEHLIEQPVAPVNPEAVA